MELRLPYAAIRVSDPSSLQALVVRLDGTLTSVPFERIAVSVVVDGELHRTDGYGWAPWDRVDWQERLKVGVAAIRDAIAPSR